MPTPPQMSEDQARQLMSKLMDGELSPTEATALDAYLQAHPEEMDWMESLDRARAHWPPAASSREGALAKIGDALSAAESRPGESKLLRFPRLLRPLAAAAVFAIAGTVAWHSLTTDHAPDIAPSIVEFVSTDIPNASTFIHSDEESGWTIVWVESQPQPQG